MTEDLFKESLKSLHVPRFSEDTFFSCLKLPQSPAARSIIERHVELLCIVGDHVTLSNWDAANRWARAVLALAEKLPDDNEHKQLLIGVAHHCRDRHSRSLSNSVGACVVCDEEDRGNHHCDPKRIRNRDAAMTQDRSVYSDRGRTFGDRIREGFELLAEVGD